MEETIEDLLETISFIEDAMDDVFDKGGPAEGHIVWPLDNMREAFMQLNQLRVGVVSVIKLIQPDSDVVLKIMPTNC